MPELQSYLGKTRDSLEICCVLCSETLYVEMHNAKAVKNVVFISEKIRVVEGVIRVFGEVFVDGADARISRL